MHNPGPPLPLEACEGVAAIGIDGYCGKEFATPLSLYQKIAIQAANRRRRVIRSPSPANPPVCTTTPISTPAAFWRGILPVHPLAIHEEFKLHPLTPNRVLA